MRPDMEEEFQPGTGSTAKPGAAALRRTPGKKMEIFPNPSGVPLRPMHARRTCICDVEPRWGSYVFVGGSPGMRRSHGDPRLCCETPLGLSALGINLTVRALASGGIPGSGEELRARCRRKRIF